MKNFYLFFTFLSYKIFVKMCIFGKKQTNLYLFIPFYFVFLDCIKCLWQHLMVNKNREFDHLSFGQFCGSLKVPK